jgi:hypothetical protein
VADDKDREPWFIGFDAETMNELAFDINEWVREHRRRHPGMRIRRTQLSAVQEVVTRDPYIPATQHEPKMHFTALVNYDLPPEKT